MRSWNAKLALLASMATVGACRSGPEPAKAETGAVDSVVPREVALARFQADLPQVDSLAGGASSRDELVRRFIRAVERQDTTELRALHITKAEFAYLYYPTNPQGLPPYDLSPGLFWFMLEGHSERGARDALTKRGTTDLGYLGYRCEGEPSREGENTVWAPCVVLRRSAGADTVRERLFGQIVERNGRYKFASYANGLD